MFISYVNLPGTQIGPIVEEEGNPSIKAWWEKLRHQLAESTVTSQTLSAAVCCRSVVLEKQLAAKKLEVRWKYG
jgi:hypothetical protein